MIVKIKPQLEIGGMTWEFKWGDKVTANLSNRNFWGECSHNTREVSLRHDMTSQQLMCTFIHELLHCVDDSYLNTVLDEKQVGGLAEGLTQIFRQLGIEFRLGKGNL